MREGKAAHCESGENLAPTSPGMFACSRDSHLKRRKRKKRILLGKVLDDGRDDDCAVLTHKTLPNLEARFIRVERARFQVDSQSSRELDVDSIVSKTLKPRLAADECFNPKQGLLGVTKVTDGVFSNRKPRESSRCFLSHSLFFRLLLFHVTLARRGKDEGDGKDLSKA